jgi:CubicO group peptidase (beta-lactamase class C family)
MNLIQAQIQKEKLVKGEAIYTEISPNEKVDELFAVWDGNGTPGAAVAVVRDGAVIYKKGYGMANLEYDIPISPSSIFHIASVSKQFTVFSILLLQSEGKVDLDDDIRNYMPTLTS